MPYSAASQAVVKVLKAAQPGRERVRCAAWWFLQHRLDFSDDRVEPWLRSELPTALADGIINMDAPPFVSYVPASGTASAGTGSGVVDDRGAGEVGDEQHLPGSRQGTRGGGEAAP